MRDFLDMFLDNWLGRFVLIFITILFVGLAVSIIYPLTHKCLASHWEVQYHMPPGVVVGGSKYGGGVSIPIGNATPVNVEVCDKYE